MVIPERVKEQDSLKYLSKNILVSAQQFDQIKVGNVSGSPGTKNGKHFQLNRAYLVVHKHIIAVGIFLIIEYYIVYNFKLLIGSSSITL